MIELYASATPLSVRLVRARATLISPDRAVSACGDFVVVMGVRWRR
jgi:hypothetical protein